jgi:hypothetical protein
VSRIVVSALLCLGISVKNIKEKIMNNKNIINCPECGAALDIDNVLFHQLDEKAKNSLQDEYNAVD